MVEENSREKLNRTQASNFKEHEGTDFETRVMNFDET